MSPNPRTSVALALVLAVAAGCQGEPEGNELTPDPTGLALGAASEPAAAELNGKLSQLINDHTAKYRPLDYEYNEDLLVILDRVDARLAGKLDKLDPLPLPKLDEAEQLAHFRETIRRWSDKTKKTLRAELEPLKVDVAARKPGSSFHPEFQKKFAAVFDDFIPIEVAEIRERRNRALHEATKPVLDEYRGKAPEAVKQAEQTLNAPPYNLPETPPASESTPAQENR